MDDSTSARSSRAQLRTAEQRIRGMARQVGVHLVIWGHVRKDMASIGIEELDLTQALTNCTVEEYEVYGNIERYVAVGRDTDDRDLRITVVLNEERFIIEVVSVATE